MYNNKMPLTKKYLLPFLCNVSDQYDSGIAIINLEQNDFPIIYINKAFTELTGYELKELSGHNIQSLKGIKTNLTKEKELLYHFKHKTPFEINLIHYHKDRTAFWNNITFQPIQSSDDTTTYAILHFKDRTESMLNKMLSKLEHEVYIELEENGDLKRILQLITEKVELFYLRDIYCSIHVIDSQVKLKAIASGTLPLSLIKSISNLKFSNIIEYNHSTVFINDLTVEHANTRRLIKKYNLSSCWSKPIFNHEKKLIGYFTIYIKSNSKLKQADIRFLKKLTPIIALSMKYVEQKHELKRLAFYDIATDLPNYNYFYTNLSQWVQNHDYGSILIIQPTEYTSIVDLYGRKFGDELFRQMTNRLSQESISNSDVLYGRFSNSTFIIGIKDNNIQLNDYIAQLLEMTVMPFIIAEREIFISLKIGVSYFEKSISIDESIRRADMALTRARTCNETVSYFEIETDEKIQRELDILNQLRSGLNNDEFQVYLQPKINLHTKEIEGFEALARWDSPTLGRISPVEFIRVAEQGGKINEIDQLILKNVLKFQNERLLNGDKIVPIAVNISPVHFYSHSFVKEFITIVNEYDIDSKFIKIEVTESVELFDFEKAKAILIELKKYGYDSSIDDFGVGFSSLSYLQQLPFSEIKIDRSFINEIKNDGMHAVVQTIVQLANNLQMHVVAEGIETVEQYNILQKMGCKTGQGYFFHKPMPILEAEKLLMI